MKIILASASPRRRELLEQIGLPFTVMTSHVEERISSVRPEEVVLELSRQKAEAVGEKLCRKRDVSCGAESREETKEPGEQQCHERDASCGAEPCEETKEPGEQQCHERDASCGAESCEETKEPGGQQCHERDASCCAEPRENVMALEEELLVIGADTVVALDGVILGKPSDSEDAFEMLMRLQGREHEVYTGVTLLYRSQGAVKWSVKCFYERTKVSFFSMSKEEIMEYVKTGDPLDKAGAYGIQGFCARYVRGIEGDYNNVVGLPAGRLYQEIKEWTEIEKSGDL